MTVDSINTATDGLRVPADQVRRDEPVVIKPSRPLPP
jgi:hypothetical protein